VNKILVNVTLKGPAN